MTPNGESPRPGRVVGFIVVRKGIQWCPHCHQPHRLGERFCRETGQPLEQDVHVAAAAAEVERGGGGGGGGGGRHRLCGMVVGGRYRIVDRIGVGGMGEIFEAENLVLRRRVVLKVVSDASKNGRRRLREEGRVIAALQHPNICDLYDVGELPDGAPYLVLERLKGETLLAYMRRVGPAPLAETLDIFLQMLSALHSAHGAGIIHRDLKPANVFLVPRQGYRVHVKLLDFGLAKALDRSARSMTSLTQPGRAVGTLAYMSPEQLLTHPVDPRSDLFCLALMLFEMLAGEHPFAAPTRDQVANNIVSLDPNRLSNFCSVPPRLEQVIRACLSRTPGKRPASAAALQAELSAVLQEVNADGGETNAQTRLPRLTSESGATSASG